MRFLVGGTRPAARRADRRCRRPRACWRQAAGGVLSLLLLSDARAASGAPDVPPPADCARSARPDGFDRSWLAPPPPEEATPSPTGGNGTGAVRLPAAWLPAGDATAAQDDGWRRWIDVPTAEASLRYRARRFPADPAVQRNLESRVGLRMRLKFDPEGRFLLEALGASGSRFQSTWNDTGLGAGSPSYQVAVRELWAAVRPLSAVRFEVGGLGIARGASTEATTYDNDGYIAGQRITLGRAADRGVGRVLVTRAFLGNLDRPNVLPRLRRLDRANYHQVLLTREFSRARTSAEYTRHGSRDVVRAAALVDLRGARVVDRLRAETYVRLDPDAARGFAITLRRRLIPATHLDMGFARIDPDYGPLNGDRFANGQRAFGGVILEAAPGLTLSTMLLQVVGGERFTGPRTRLDVVLTYDVARTWR
jgi:hypothetical protein